MSFAPFLYLIPAAVVGVLYLLSGEEELPGDGGEATEGIRGAFARIGLYLYHTLPFFRRKGHGAEVAASLGVLEPRRAADDAKNLYYADKIGMSLLVVCAGSVLAALVSFSARQEHTVVDGAYIEREDYGKGAREETLVLSSADGAGVESEIDVTVTERRYTREEADLLYREFANLLPQHILGNNPSLDEVRSDLKLVESIEGYPFAVAWRIGNYDVIHADGELQTENIPPEGILVTLTAQVSYLEYDWEVELPICALPPLYTEEELWQQGMQRILREADLRSVSEAYMALPTQIGTSLYRWSGKVQDDAPLLFLIILVAAAAVFATKDKDLRKRVQEREEELVRDYPQFVSKLTLYLGAGMTVRSIFLKLAADHAAVRAEAGQPVRFLGEELRRVANELESGVSESAAYEHFSMRCRAQPYTRLVALLTQNLRKGNSGLLPLLREESGKALAERMDHARKRGEEAGTKLLLPMMLMLVVVMVIIMLPAFLSF